MRNGYRKFLTLLLILPFGLFAQGDRPGAPVLLRGAGHASEMDGRGTLNDDCESATSITCGSSTMGSTLVALPDNPPECGTPISAPGVWYSFTGVSGTVILSTCADHGYDTKINV